MSEMQSLIWLYTKLATNNTASNLYLLRVFHPHTTPRNLRPWRRPLNIALQNSKWGKFFGMVTSEVQWSPFRYVLTVAKEIQDCGKNLQKIVGITSFTSKESTLFDIKWALQKGHFRSFAEEGRSRDPRTPLVVHLGVGYQILLYLAKAVARAFWVAFLLLMFSSPLPPSPVLINAKTWTWLVARGSLT